MEHQAHPPPLDIVRVTSSTYSKGGTKLLKGGTKLLKGGTKLLKGGTKLLKGGTKSLGWATGGVVRPPPPTPPPPATGLVYIECLYVMSTDMVWHAAIFIFITHLCFINHLICLFYLVILCCIYHMLSTYIYVCVSKRQKITFCIQALHIHRHDKQTYKLTTYDIYTCIHITTYNI